jgi:hypothetical protein
MLKRLHAVALTGLSTDFVLANNNKLLKDFLIILLMAACYVDMCLYLCYAKNNHNNFGNFLSRICPTVTLFFPPLGSA